MAISWDELNEIMKRNGIGETDRRDILRSMRKKVADNEEIASVNIGSNGEVTTTVQPKAKTSGTRS